MTDQLPTLRLCTAGSVDDGKSTFVGRLLHDTKSILSDQYDAVQRSSEARGLAEADLSLLVDGLRAEREQGITIDVAYRYFATDKRSFILADCPGHEQYTRNTVTGMSTADAVVLLVDARNGVIRQTSRHATVAGLLKVPHVIVAVNKIDLLDYSEDAFREIEKQVEQLADRAHLAEVSVVPISSLKGDNVVDRSDNTPWYDGPSVLELLETIEVNSDASEQDFRLPVQYVIRDHDSEYRGFAGRVAAGTLRIGDTVTLPEGRSARVTGISLAGEKIAEGESVSAGDSISIELDTEIDLSRGDLITGQSRPEDVREFEATVVQMGGRTLGVGRQVLVRYGAGQVRARLASVEGLVDVDTGSILSTRPGDFNEEPITGLEINDVAQVRIQTASDLPIEPFRVGGQIGAFLLIDPQSGDTLTAGLAQ